MFNWDEHVGRDPLICAATGTPVTPGETYICALAFHEGRFERSTYTEAAWTAVETDSIAHWRRRRPEEESPSGPRLVDHKALMAIFHQLRGATDRPQQCLLWIITLILVRARKLRYVDLVRDASGTTMLVRETGGHRARGYRILDPLLAEEETLRLQDDITRLFEEGVPVEEDDTDGENGNPDENHSGGGGSLNTESGGGPLVQPGEE